MGPGAGLKAFYRREGKEKKKGAGKADILQYLVTAKFNERLSLNHGGAAADFTC